MSPSELSSELELEHGKSMTNCGVTGRSLFKPLNENECEDLSVIADMSGTLIDGCQRLLRTYV